jgi:tryptophanyl-tRNA synthetase
VLLQACDGLLVVLGLDAQNLLIFAQVDVPDLTSLESGIFHMMACDSSLF